MPLLGIATVDGGDRPLKGRGRGPAATGAAATARQVSPHVSVILMAALSAAAISCTVTVFPRSRRLQIVAAA